GGLDPVAYFEFGQDGGDVMVDGPHRAVQLVGDLLVGVASGEELDDLCLAFGEVGRVGSGGRRRTPRDPVTKGAHLRLDVSKGGSGTERYERGSSPFELPV